MIGNWRFSLLLLMLWTGQAMAASGPACVGLVLGGGGARGAAHIGVLKVLEQRRIPVCAIAGTSVGSVIGSFYAVGYTPDQIEAIVTGIDWNNIFEDEPIRPLLPMRRKDEDYRYLLGFKLGFRDGKVLLPPGAIQGQKLLLLLRRLLLPAWKITDFSRLPIPFSCVGADIGNGEGVVYGKGDLASAVRASMSVPGAFAPIRLDDRLMVDGSIFNNVPVDVVRAMGADRIIAVDVSSPLAPAEALDSSFAVAMQMVDMMMHQRTSAMLATLDAADVLIKPDLSGVSATSFDRTREAIAAGEAAANDLVDALDHLALSEADYAAHVAARRKLSFDPPLVEFVEIASHRSRSAALVAEQVRQSPNQPLDIDTLERDIGLAYGQGTYERISWALHEADGKTGIRILPVDKGWGPNYLAFGMQLSDDFRGDTSYSLAVESTTTGINPRGGEWRNRVEIGRVTGMRSEFYQPWGRLGRWYVLPFIDYAAFDQTVRPAPGVFGDFRIDRIQHGISAGFNLSPTMRFELGNAFGRDRADLRAALRGDFADVDSDFAATYAGFTYDALDDIGFPTRGARFAIEATSYDDHLGGDATGDRTSFAFDYARPLGERNRLLFGLTGSVSSGDDDLFQRLTLLGGFLNLSGFPEQALASNNSALGRVVAYRRFANLSTYFDLPAYVGVSLEAGNVWVRQRDMSIDSLIISGSTFIGLETPLGPVFVAYGLADTGDDALYFSFETMLRPFGRRR